MQQPTENQRKVTALYALALNYGKRFDEQLMDYWMRLLGPYRAAQVEAGVEKVIGEYEYKTIPPFAILKKAMDSLFEGDNKAPTPEQAREIAANQEWDLVMAEIQKKGWQNVGSFSETTEQCLRTIGGIRMVAMCNEDDLHWKKRDFVEAFVRRAEFEPYYALPTDQLLAIGQGSHGPYLDQRRAQIPVGAGVVLRKMGLLQQGQQRVVNQ